MVLDGVVADVVRHHAVGTGQVRHGLRHRHGPRASEVKRRNLPQTREGSPSESTVSAWAARKLNNRSRASSSDSGDDRRREQRGVHRAGLARSRACPPGIPAGICTIDSSESIPLRACDSIGTPSTGRWVEAAITPGKRGRAAGRCDHDLDATVGGGARPLRRLLGRPVGRQDLRLERDPQVLERRARVLHDVPVRLRAHRSRPPVHRPWPQSSREARVSHLTRWGRRAWTTSHAPDTRRRSTIRNAEWRRPASGVRDSSVTAERTPSRPAIASIDDIEIRTISRRRHRTMPGSTRGSMFDGHGRVLAETHLQEQLRMPPPATCTRPTVTSSLN